MAPVLGKCRSHRLYVGTCLINRLSDRPSTGSGDRIRVARDIGGAHLEGVGAAEKTGVPSRRHTGAEGEGAELALGGRV